MKYNINIFKYHFHKLGVQKGRAGVAALEPVV